MSLTKTFFLVIVPSIFIAGNSPDVQTDTLISTADLPTATEQFITEFEFVKNKSLGLTVTNPKNNNIGYEPALNGFTIINDVYWKPINGKKMVLCGTLEEYFVHDESGDEYDWNLRIIPDPDFEFIINEVRKVVSFEDEIKWKLCNGNNDAVSCLYAEVTPDQTLYENVWFPNRYVNPNFYSGVPNQPYYIQPPALMLNQQIGVYGAWVRDSDHGWWPEIHPLEAIWWKSVIPNMETFYVFCIQDDSNRFDTNGDFERNDNTPDTWIPWVKPPLTNEIKIPFEYDRKYSDHLKIIITELKDHNVVTGTDETLKDSDDGQFHILKIKSVAPNRDSFGANEPDNILVEVEERFPDGTHLAVNFTEICKRPNGNIIGYITLTTSYGKIGDDKEGYHLLQVTALKPTQLIRVQEFEVTPQIRNN